MKGRSVFLVLALLLSVITTAGCGSKVKPGTAEIKRPVVTGVTLATVQKVKADTYYETSGSIKALSVSTISSKAMGTVTAVLVKEGERVNAGQVLATLEDNDLASRAAAAQAGYHEALKAVEAAAKHANLAAITYQRYQQLYQDKAITQQEMDQQATQKQVADIELERARAGAARAQAESQVYRSLMQLIAPTSGVVTAKRIDLGSTAVPGVPLFTVEDTSAFTFEADVDESLVGILRPGMPAEIGVDAVGRSIAAVITEVAPTIDPASRKFHIKLSLTGEGLKSGLYGKLRLPTETKEAIILPTTAVVAKGQLTGVYVVNDAKVITYRLVRLGKSYNASVEILSGLTEGEKVIVGGVEQAIDGGILNEVNLP